MEAQGKVRGREDRERLDKNCSDCLFIGEMRIELISRVFRGSVMNSSNKCTKIGRHSTLSDRAKCYASQSSARQIIGNVVVEV